MDIKIRGIAAGLGENPTHQHIRPICSTYDGHTDQLLHAVHLIQQAEQDAPVGSTGNIRISLGAGSRQSVYLILHPITCGCDCDFGTRE